MNKANDKEFKKTEGQSLIQEHWQKTLSTIEVLMRQMNMMYYYQKLGLELDKY
jgi:hypothetical protein